MALVLLVGAGLLVRNFEGLLNVNESFSPETLLTMNLSLPQAQYDKTARLNFHEQVLRRLAGVPGVQSVALATQVPYANGGGAYTPDFSIEDRVLTERSEQRVAIVETITPSYLEMLRVGLRDGRELKDSDGAETTPVAVISASLVRRYFGGENPLGKHIRIGKEDASQPWMTVVGVVNDVHYSWFSKESIPTIYRSFRQAPPTFTTIVLRTSGDPKQMISPVRSQVAAVDPDLPLYNIKPMDKVITESIVGIAYVATMMAVLGTIALVLASVGVFGVMSYAVSERSHELGVRMSLGAQSSDILRLVLRNGLLLTTLGLAIGLPVAFLLARLLSTLLFGVEAADPLSLVGLPLLLIAVAAVACYLPARRAARLDPLRALRHE